ncbi:MAG: repeat protein, partial [Chthonomonadales bacterium]|nr:repeat protein [Chthonomonadales bacterium]
MVWKRRRGVTPAGCRKLALLSLLLGGSLLMPGCTGEKGKRPDAQAPTLQGTAARLTIPQMVAELNKKMDPECYLLNTQRAALLRAKLDKMAETHDPSDHVNPTMQYAEELINSGKLDEALQTYRSLELEITTTNPAMWKAAGSSMLVRESIAYMRMGEQQNCCDRNNPNSCLIPIAGSGIHTKQEGSRGAIKCLNTALQLEPNNLSARWLLNLAYMTIGEYPQKVPAKWLIPLKAFGGDYPLPKFYNAAPDMGLDFLGWAGGIIMEDFEGNGRLDLVISSLRPDGPLRYIHNNGDGTFTERTKEAGFAGEVNSLNIISTDYNNDGRPDIIVLRGGWMNKNGRYPLSLLRNDGNGHFTDVTLEAGLLTLGPTQTAVSLDYNGDGFLDLFVAYESRQDDSNPCKLFRNNGNGTFTDVSKQCGVDLVRFVKGVVSADFMHSGRPGLYLSCQGQPNVLLRNDGPAGTDKSPTAPWKFTDVSRNAGVDLQRSSFSCFFFDYDNDGWPDLYVNGYGGVRSVGHVAADYLGLPTPGEKAKLYHNNHDGTFTDISKQARLDRVNMGMGMNFGDLDNDGWLDFYVGTGNPDIGLLIPNRMFRNHDGKYFDEVTTTGDFGHLQKGHGIAFGDLRNNGQQDVYLVAGGAYEGDTAHNCLYLNPGSKNHWVTLQLSGVKSNRIALGAEICVTVTTPQGERKIYKTVGPGGSFGNNPFRQAIGLGNATAIKQVSIHWPASGIDQTIPNLSMDHFYKIK